MTDCTFNVEVVGEIIKGNKRIKVIDNERDGFLSELGYRDLIRAEVELLNTLSRIPVSISTSLFQKWILEGDYCEPAETSCRGCSGSKKE